MRADFPEEDPEELGFEGGVGFPQVVGAGGTTRGWSSRGGGLAGGDRAAGDPAGVGPRPHSWAEGAWNVFVQGKECV